MTTGKIISLLGLSLLIMYAIYQIMDFYGVNISEYGYYFVFYLFILLSYFVLPSNYKNVAA